MRKQCQKREAKQMRKKMRKKMQKKMQILELRIFCIFACIGLHFPGPRFLGMHFLVNFCCILIKFGNLKNELDFTS